MFSLTCRPVNGLFFPTAFHSTFCPPLFFRLYIICLPELDEITEVARYYKIV